MHTAVKTRPRIVVVDPRGDAYAHLRGTDISVCHPPVSQSRGADCSIHLLQSGEEALKHRSRRPAIWLVHIDLPDMSGLDLCQLLRARHVETPVCLVDEFYSPRRERAAYRRGATLYTCKPITAEWLTHWLPDMAPA